MSEARKRLEPEIFDIAVQKIRRGYYSAVYFWRTKQILEKIKYNKKVIMQVFQKKDAILCGIDEAIAVLKLCSGYYRQPDKAYKLFDQFLEREKEERRLRFEKNTEKRKQTLLEMVELETELDDLWKNTFSELEIFALYDGDKIDSWETVMTIKGLPQYFAHLESVYLGILARRTLVATNVAKSVEAARGKPILFFADRFDDYKNQTGDGYAAMKAGAFGVASDTMGEWWNTRGKGTLPHALIACFEGNTAEAALAFAKQYPEVPCIVLVDFDNNCVQTSLEVSERFCQEGIPLWGVRLDTSENMIDKSIIAYDQLGQNKPTGVTPDLVNNVRTALDLSGGRDVKIVVSGGFTAEKIDYFERMKTSVDMYGCGSSLLKGDNDFTADIVIVDDKLCAKKGRWYRPNSRLDIVR